MLKFGKQVVAIATVSFGGDDVRVLIETWEWSYIAAGDAERAARKDAFGIDHVAEQFLQTPFAGRVAMEPTGAIKSSEQREDFV